MSKAIAIHAQALSKRYKVYDKPADIFWEAITRKPRFREAWALRDVSFEVKRGEVVGIIGRNGAGKSTLLRMLAGTLPVTSGMLDVRGKVSAILELGTGFHPEFTGRENIYMGGMCLGMSRAEVDTKVDSIIDFAELRHVIDQPFKTYSSGMMARLTFSTAISIEPDILLLDEALAAGDVLFQEKCFRRIREIVDSNATVLFVTHSLSQIYQLCDSAILLSKGKVVTQGEVRKVGYAYEELLAKERKESVDASLPDPVLEIGEAGGSDAAGAAPKGSATSAVVAEMEAAADSSADADSAATDDAKDVPVPRGDGDSGEEDSGEADSGAAGSGEQDSAALATAARASSSQGKPATAGGPARRGWIRHVELVNDRGVQVSELHYGQTYRLRVELEAGQDVPALSVGFRIELGTGQVVYGSTTVTQGVAIKARAGERIVASFEWRCTLGGGEFLVTAGLAEMISESEFVILHHYGGACECVVHGSPLFQGMVDLGCKASVETVSETASPR